jgi:hypothetical protein
MHDYIDKLGVNDARRAYARYNEGYVREDDG